MKIAFLILLVINLPQLYQCTVYLRTKNDRGPLATLAGVKCLWNLTSLYFYEVLPTRTKNCVVLHTHNLSAPAYDIEKKFLTMLNLNLASGSRGYQLRIIADNYKISGSQNVPSNLMTLTDYYVLVVDDFQLFYENMRNYVTQVSAWNPSAKFVILFNNPMIRDRSEMGQKLFEVMSVKFHVVDVILLYAVGMISYDILIANPFDGENCREISVIPIGKCEMGDITDYEVVKDIAQQPTIKFNLDNCYLFLCCQVAAPFVDQNCDSGLEIELIRMLTDVMHFKIHTICSDKDRGNVLDNGEITGLLGMILDNKCDFIAGGFFPDDEVHKEFAVTLTYFEDSYTWFVPIALNRPRWEGLLMIFQKDTWLVLGLIIMLSAISWFIFGLLPNEDFHHRMFGLSFLNSFQVFLGVSANNRPVRAPLKIFFIVLSLYGLNVTTLYTSHLIAVFTNEEKYDQIDSVKEIIDNKLEIGGRMEYRDWFKNDGVEDQLILSKFNVSPDFLPTTSNLDRIRRTGKYAILANRLFVLTNKMGSKVYGLKTNVFSNQLEMITLKGFPLLAEMNLYISQLKDAGLVAKIYKDFHFNISIIARIRNMLNHDFDDEFDDEQVVLTLGHLEGPFAMLIAGIIVSVIVFMFELLSVAPCIKWILEIIAGYYQRLFNIKSDYKKMEEIKVQQPIPKNKSKRKPRETVVKPDKTDHAEVVEIRFRHFDNYNKFTKLKKPPTKIY